MTARTVLVTGATGFVGRHLVRHLLQLGYDTHAICRRSSNVGSMIYQPHSLRLHVHDGTLASMQAILSEVQPEIVFHLGSLFMASHQPEDVDRLIDSNIRFGTHLVEAAVAEGVRRFVNTGTAWQHFHSSDYNPVCLYAATKEAFEVVLRYYQEVEGLNVINLKLFDTYGPHDERGKLLSQLKKATVSGDPLLMSEGNQLIDLVHVDDVVRAFSIASDRLLQHVGPESLFQTFAVTSGAPISLRSLVELFSDLANRPCLVQWGSRPYRKREVMRPWSAGRALPGWHPRVNLADGIRQVLADGARQ